MEQFTDKRKETNWCVYMHESRYDGKKYIGATSQKPTKRWANGDGYKRCPLFYAAIQESGWDAFRHEILFTNLAEDEAYQIEEELIAKYQTQDPEKGYNMAAGGKVNHGFHRTEEEWRQRVETRKSRYVKENHPFYGKHRTEEEKRKIREAQLGVPKPDEVKANMSKSAYKRWSPDNVAEREYLRSLNLGANSPVARAVMCVETGKVYGTAGLAGEDTGAEPTGITRCCRGQRNTAGGYQWRYADEAVTVDG